MTEIVDVSVVCANYNNARYLDDFFQSFERSTVLPRELLFIDDGSEDSSVEIAKSYNERLPYLRVIALDDNVGFANALNVGIDIASSRFLMRVDPDDIVQPDRIRAQFDMLMTGKFDVVGSNADMFSGDDRPLGRTNFPVDHADIQRTIQRGEHGVLHPTVMGLCSLFKTHRYRQNNVPAEDFDIFARMLSKGARFGNSPDPLLRYRIHADSASSRLKISTIRTTFSLRDQIFGTRTSPITVFLYFIYIKFYRKYLLERRFMWRYLFLSVSIMCYPSKLLKRLARRK